MSESPATILRDLRVGQIAHGGFCVARHEGRVVFVRHALPGELIDAVVTDQSKAKYWRADAVTIHEPSDERVTPPCPIAGECGGCDFQHVAVGAQRRLKAAVVAEQLRRLAGIDWDVKVRPVDGDTNGLGWRTRMDYPVEAGVVGLRAARTHRVVPLPETGCAIAHPGIADPREFASRARERVRMVASSDGRTVLVDGEVAEGTPVVTERAGRRSYRVAADGFWQVHPGAANTLVNAVMAGLEPRAGEMALDLYCGVGLFAGALADAGAEVVGVERAGSAIELARRNVRAARFIAAPVERSLDRMPTSADLVVLDPPRSGAGPAVCRHLAGLKARRICYVACDPAALARDLKAFADARYVVTSIEAFDLFPMTHHVECVAVLQPH